MTRREFTKGLVTVGAASGFRLPLANAADYRGKLFAFVQAAGGWDPTSFCDPKANSPGEPVINNWAQSQQIRQAGNIPYAPFARNQAFFEKILSPDVGDQWRGRPDQLPHHRSDSQLERPGCGRIPHDHGIAGCAQRGWPGNALPDVRGLLEDGRPDNLHAAGGIRTASRMLSSRKNTPTARAVHTSAARDWDYAQEFSGRPERHATPRLPTSCPGQLATGASTNQRSFLKRPKASGHSPT